MCPKIWNTNGSVHFASPPSTSCYETKHNHLCFVLFTNLYYPFIMYHNKISRRVAIQIKRKITPHVRASSFCHWINSQFLVAYRKTSARSWTRKPRVHMRIILHVYSTLLYKVELEEWYANAIKKYFIPTSACQKRTLTTRNNSKLSCTKFKYPEKRAIY